jgi:osmoprotectant transport system permease protein
MLATLLIAQDNLDLKQETGQNCVRDNGFCPKWIEDNWGDYVTPLVQHAYLTALIVLIGFVISFVLAVIAHRERWLTGPIIGATGFLYTIPSIGFFILLIPIVGLGLTGVLIVMVSYTLLILFRNITLGLRNVPRETVDAGRGMGLTANQLLWRVELPLALPEIFAGLRIAATTTVGLLTLAYLGGSDQGLTQFFSSPDQLSFQSNVVLAGGLCLALAAVFDVVILLAQRLSTPWVRARR